jgi:hypothetical protein
MSDEKNVHISATLARFDGALQLMAVWARCGASRDEFAYSRNSEETVTQE